MIREVDLVSYLPAYLKEYKEQNNTLSSQSLEFAIMWQATDRVLRNEFIMTADEYGIARFEKLLGILPYKEDTLESRRSRVQLRWFASLPYTMKTLIMRLIALCGESNFTVSKQFLSYRLRIELNLELFGQVEEVEKMIQAILPCNMVLELKNERCYVATGELFSAGGICHIEKYIISEM